MAASRKTTRRPVPSKTRAKGVKKGSVMAKTPDRSTPGTGLRQQAEVRLRATRRDIAAMPVKDVQQLVHELQVHQIELEMQNDELSRAQMELESARDRYVDLYDSSPAGHLTLDIHGTIVEANLRAGMLLGLTRNKLIGHALANLIASCDVGTFHRHGQKVVKSGTRQTCEVQLRTKAGASCWVSFESQAVHEEPGRSTHWRTAFQNISDRKRVEQELVSRQAQIEGVIASAMDAIITVDEGERVVVFNRAAESMFLCPAADAIGQPLDRFIPKRFRQAHHSYVSRFARTHATSRSMGNPGTLFGLRANGEEFPLEASISHVQVDGKTLLTVILRDVTARMIAEGALKASETFTRTVLDSIPSQVCVLDKNGVLLKTNDAWKEFAGRDSNRVVPHSDIGQNYLEACRRASAGGDSTAQMILGAIEGVLGGRQPRFSAEYACHLPEEERWYLMRVASLKESQGVVVSHTDISERVRMTRLVEHHVLLLNDKREELESLTGKLLAAQEEERKRIARDLHDDFNQRLAALAVELESMERAPIAPPKSLVRQLAAIRIQVGQLSDNLHDLAYKLHPSLLEHVGLEVTLRDHVAEFGKRTGLFVTFTAREVPETLSSEVATNLFRVMQESLQNVSKHAEATDVTVRLSGSSKGVGVSVRDNGKGFDFERKKDRVRGLGLVSMQERARGLGGFLRIHSLPRGGTKVCAWIPHFQEGT